MPFHFEKLVNQYYQNANGDNYPRLRGWEFLWDYIQGQSEWIDLVSEKNIERTALHLGFYLANWGMFRGSSGLLNTNMDFFKDLSSHLFQNIPIDFWDTTFADFSPDNEEKLKLSSELFDCAINEMESFEFDRITWTETLKSKILLGFWGQCPAIDTFYSRGIRLFLNINPQFKIAPKGKINAKSLSSLNVVSQKLGWNLAGNFTHHGKNEYPPGKVIDMAFFQYGRNNSKKWL